MGFVFLADAVFVFLVLGLAGVSPVDAEDAAPSDEPDTTGVDVLEAAHGSGSPPPEVLAAFFSASRFIIATERQRGVFVFPDGSEFASTHLHSLLALQAASSILKHGEFFEACLVLSVGAVVEAAASVDIVFVDDVVRSDVPGFAALAAVFFLCFVGGGVAPD